MARIPVEASSPRSSQASRPRAAAGFSSSGGAPSRLPSVAVPTAAAVFSCAPATSGSTARLLFGLGASVPSPAGSSGDSSGRQVRVGNVDPGKRRCDFRPARRRRFLRPRMSGSLLRPRPPREPRRVFFFGRPAPFRLRLFTASASGSSAQIRHLQAGRFRLLFVSSARGRASSARS